MAAVAVGQASFVKDLQQQVENVGVRFFDFVQQDNSIRFAADAFGQLSPLVVPHIARRRANEPADGIFFHVFAHINAHKAVRGIEHIGGQQFCQVGLPHPGGSQEYERADGFVGILQPGAVAVDGPYHGFHGIVLTNDLLLEYDRHVEQTLRFRFRDAAYGHRGDHGNHFGHRVGIHLFLIGLLFRVPFVPGLAQRFNHLAFPLPQGRRLFVILLVNRLPLLHHERIQLFFHDHQFLGQLQVGNVHVRTCFVHHINGLVGQAAVGNVALGKTHAGLQRLGRIAHHVVFFVFGSDAAQDLQRIVVFGRFHDHFLETALQSTVFFNVLAVFIHGAGADALELAPCQGRFEHVGCIQRASAPPCGTCPNQGVDLVNEKDDIGILLYLGKERFHAFLELPAVFGPCHHRADVQRKDPFTLQCRGAFAVSDPVGQAFHNS